VDSSERTSPTYRKPNLMLDAILIASIIGLPAFAGIRWLYYEAIHSAEIDAASRRAVLSELADIRVHRPTHIVSTADSAAEQPEN